MTAKLTTRNVLFSALALVAIAGATVLIRDLHGDANAKASPAVATTTGTSGASMPGPMSSMSMPSTNGKVETIRGVNLPTMQTSGTAPQAMAMVPLGGATWQGMTIQTLTSAPATFILLNGAQQQLVKPTRKSSFHLMVLLSDSSTHYAIPYSSVWATITRNGKVVFDERLWPMISRYMGPHYGNNVNLPNAGLYRLSLLVSPPAAARHLEYKSLWLKPHKVGMDFRWIPKT